ncbi:hypothetical protein GA0116948_107135 [Chitinophaga costaii]|uniref:CarboxypepD_reg-like domain-containing protein n=1 Tax=Chitinophaga costaii TaxID=1335309 RepID=A0A1C4E727_9BACT|nr:hypothetical protein [Chitinophaga costaii]SCC39436.1 hypothetical protein GA0116948_107135 [Chitinophaga costaii]
MKAFPLAVFAAALLLPALANGQQHITGRTLRKDSVPIPGVSIVNRRLQIATASDANANFDLQAFTGDTILFSGLNIIARYWIVPYNAGRNIQNIFLQSRVMDLMPVSIRRHTYSDDSIAVRKEYASSFNFRRPRFTEVVALGFPGIGVNINQLYKALRIKNNKHKIFFRNQLISYEHEGFVSAHYTESLVASTVPLRGDSLTYFVNKYRPTYEQVHDGSDYDMLYFIHQSYKRFCDSLQHLNAPPQ